MNHKNGDTTYYPGVAALCPLGKKDLCNQEGYGLHTFMAEVVCTFIFISVIMIAKYDENGHDELIPNAGMIAGTLYFMIKAAGSVSGAALNPAVGLCQTVFQHEISGLRLQYIWCYIAGPTIGGVLAGAVSIISGNVVEKEIERLGS